MSVTPAMLAVALGRAAPEPGSVTEQQWDLWISDAEMLIEERRARLGVEVPDEAKLDYVVREAVADHIKRPDDATEVTVSVDDASSSRRYQSGKGRVTILDEWWALLGLVEPSGAFSLDMVGGSSVHLPWCSLMFGANYCSCGVDIAGVPIFEGGEP
ncbi:hypothetical protein ACFUOZ_00540 [Paenarthrobacter sp. NPDC057355]|uniref:hypothetical protein n=1 Tax=Paenarthrobacter sp. NPDC057355 TaxID=3346105 RepID=UPI00363CD99F